MKIGIVADPCDPHKPGGLGRCIFELAKATIEAAPQHSYVVYSKSPLPLKEIIQKPLPSHIWRASASLDPSLDVYIFFTPVIPLLFRPKRVIVVAEDFAYLELPRHTLREHVVAFATYLVHRRALRIAARVACISEATKQSAIKYFGIASEKCIITPLAGMPLTSPVHIENLPARFFLFAGILKERKNVANIIRAFAYYAGEGGDADLVIAGKKEGAYYQSLIALAQEFSVEDRVHFIGYMHDGQMSYLYKQALALVFASKIEGFGMPLVEAMRAGLPIITSNRGALAEVAGSAALLCNPDSPQELARAMTKLSHDSVLRKELIQRGISREKEFSWKKSGAKLSALLNR